MFLVVNGPNGFGAGSLTLQTGLWSRSPSNFGWPEPEPKIFRWWSRSLKFGFRFQRKFVGQASCTKNTMFLVVNGPNGFGAGSKNF